MKIWTYFVSALALILAPAFADAGTVTYYHNDLAGNPVAATNSQGQVIWRESYRPYGERTVNSAAAQDNKIWFTSRPQDASTGLVYMGARYYDPVVGRFVSTDPLSFDEKNPHSFNRYAYANNNPYRYRDPDGAQALPIVTPPPFVATRGGNVLQGKPSEAQVLKGLEGFSATGGSGFRLPSFDAADAMLFMIGGFPAITASKLDSLIFSSSGANWGNPASLADHFARRGKDFGASSADQYAQMARDFLGRAKSDGLPTKVDADGVTRVFDPASNTFGAYNSDGSTRTFFKPSSSTYWERQPGNAP
jgi:RHS repeat-associated protein